jgi:hypothetical protein
LKLSSDSKVLTRRGWLEGAGSKGLDCAEIV